MNNEDTLHHQVLILFLILISIAIIDSSFINLMRERENLESYHSILITEQMQEEALKKQLEAAEKNYLLGKFDPAQMSNFVLIPKQYTTD